MGEDTTPRQPQLLFPSTARTAIITAMIAIVPPATVAIHGWSTKSKELELAEKSKDRDIEMAEREQAFKTQSWFLQSAVDPQKTPELRQLVLRFIKGVTGDRNLSLWASKELSRIDELVILRRETKAHDAELQASKSEVARLRTLVGRNLKKGGKEELERALTALRKAEEESLALRKKLIAKGDEDQPRFLSDLLASDTSENPELRRLIQGLSIRGARNRLNEAKMEELLRAAAERRSAESPCEGFGRRLLIAPK